MHDVQRIAQLLLFWLASSIRHLELDDRWRVDNAAVSLTKTACARCYRLLSDHELVVEIPVTVSGIRLPKKELACLQLVIVHGLRYGSREWDSSRVLPRWRASRLGLWIR